MYIYPPTLVVDGTMLDKQVLSQSTFIEEDETFQTDQPSDEHAQMTSTESS